MPRVFKWCNIEKKYTNHERQMNVIIDPSTKTNKRDHNNNNRNSLLAYKPQGYDRGQMEKPQLVLGKQPPIPGINQPIVVNFLQAEDSQWEQIQAVVRVTPNIDEGSSNFSSIIETHGYKSLLPMHSP